MVTSTAGEGSNSLSRQRAQNLFKFLVVPTTAAHSTLKVHLSLSSPLLAQCLRNPFMLELEVDRPCLVT
jgi:hypothetical protein